MTKLTDCLIYAIAINIYALALVLGGVVRWIFWQRDRQIKCFGSKMNYKF